MENIVTSLPTIMFYDWKHMNKNEKELLRNNVVVKCNSKLQIAKFLVWAKKFLFPYDFAPFKHYLCFVMFHNKAVFGMWDKQLHTDTQANWEADRYKTVSCKEFFS